MDIYIRVAESGAFDEALDLRGRGDTDRVRESDLVRLELLGSSATYPGSTRPSKGQPKATLTVAVVGSSDTPRIR